MTIRYITQYVLQEQTADGWMDIVSHKSKLEVQVRKNKLEEQRELTLRILTRRHEITTETISERIIE